MCAHQAKMMMMAMVMMMTARQIKDFRRRSKQNMPYIGGEWQGGWRFVPHGIAEITAKIMLSNAV